jgi:type-F conjugative transfer system pilin assembly protein TrbC
MIFNKKLTFYLFPFLLFAQQDINKTQIFMDKYLPKERVKGVSIDKIQKVSKDLNITKIAKQMDTNKTKFNQKYGVVFNTNKEADKIANSIYKFSKTQKFNKDVTNSEKYILYDKGFNFQKYLGIYKEKSKDIVENRDKFLSKNKFLNKDEKIFVVISSSIPKQTIKNYFEAVQPVNTDVTFVLRGVIDSIHHIQPTLKWLNSIVIKNPDSNVSNPKNRYQVNLQINPKVTRRYNIERVPAVIYIKHYNPIVEMQKSIIGKPDKDEKVYIIYGDIDIRYSLEKVNKKVHSKGLDRLLKAMQRGFFSK